MGELRQLLRQAEKHTEPDKPAWRMVHICTDDHSWCVSDPDGIRDGQGEPYPEQLPGDVVFITNIRADAL